MADRRTCNQPGSAASCPGTCRLAGRATGHLALGPARTVRTRAQAGTLSRRPVRRGGRTRLTGRLGAELAERISAGGYPAALARRTAARRRAWYRDLIETQIQRDVRDPSRLRSFDTLPRLLAQAASHTVRLLNVSDLTGPFQLTRQTIHDHVTLLERLFLLERLPPWRRNRLSRLGKTAKLHIASAAVANRCRRDRAGERGRCRFRAHAASRSRRRDRTAPSVTSRRGVHLRAAARQHAGRRARRGIRRGSRGARLIQWAGPRICWIRASSSSALAKAPHRKPSMRSSV